jgi:hypothetical protein
VNDEPIEVIFNRDTGRCSAKFKRSLLAKLSRGGIEKREKLEIFLPGVESR